MAVAWDARARTLTYDGVEGKTAGELLLAATGVKARVRGHGEQMYVTAINGVEASTARHEYWALSIDGHLADVGAGSAVTHDGQTITWELESYK